MAVHVPRWWPPLKTARVLIPTCHSEWHTRAAAGHQVLGLNQTPRSRGSAASASAAAAEPAAETTAAGATAVPVDDSAVAAAAAVASESSAVPAPAALTADGVMAALRQVSTSDAAP